jgi:hypothetical protein
MYEKRREKERSSRIRTNKPTRTMSEFVCAGLLHYSIFLQEKERRKNQFYEFLRARSVVIIESDKNGVHRKCHRLNCIMYALLVFIL